MKTILAAFVFLFISSTTKAEPVNAAPILKDFETDGCTMFVEGTVSKPNLWGHCCFDHDLRYWFGGSSENKDVADVDLRSCVKAAAGNFWANLIYKGVRSGKYSPLKHKYAWSWAWDPKRENTELTSIETKYVIEKLNAMDLDSKYREEFIKKYLITSQIYPSWQ